MPFEGRDDVIDRGSSEWTIEGLKTVRRIPGWNFNGGSLSCKYFIINYLNKNTLSLYGR
jgi:hypothetical protein